MLVATKASAIMSADLFETSSLSTTNTSSVLAALLHKSSVRLRGTQTRLEG